ncbi:MAG: hypothetical protein ACRECH_12200, partial [Nitrososphaerales archaeon]
MTSLAFQKYDRSEPRSIVSKTIPGYVQTFTYDLVSTNPTIQIDGTLIGTSNANLASQIETLKAMHRNRKVVWIDASDQYQGLIDFCRIIKLQGPTMDSKTGPLIATFSLEAVSLLPWGTTQFNPYNTSGVVLRDLSGVGKEVVLNPLSMNCNYILSSSLQSDQGGNGSNWFSWEFILDNQNAFTEATSVQINNCDTLTNTVNGAIAGGSFATVSAFGTLSNDTGNVKEGVASLKGKNNSSTANTFYAMTYDLGSAGQNWSNYDRLRMWFNCDQSGQTAYKISILDTSGRVRTWAFSLQAANTWQNVELKMSNYSGQDTGFDITHVRYVGADVEAASTTELTLWIDDIRAEVGFLDHGDDTFQITTKSGTGVTFSNDSFIYKNSTYPSSSWNPLGITPTAETSLNPSSLKMSGTSDSSGNLGLVQTLIPSAWDFTSPTAYDFLVLWVRSDFGGNVTGTIQVMLATTAWTAFFQWNYASLNANQWYRLVVPLANSTSKTGSPNLNSIAALQVNSVGKASVASNLWVDEISSDVGILVPLEFQIPDAVSQTTQYPILVQSWNGSSYLTFSEESAQGDTVQNPNNISYL